MLAAIESWYVGKGSKCDGVSMGIHKMHVQYISPLQTVVSEIDAIASAHYLILDLILGCAAMWDGGAGLRRVQHGLLRELRGESAALSVQRAAFAHDQRSRKGWRCDMRWLLNRAGRWEKDDILDA